MILRHTTLEGIISILKKTLAEKYLTFYTTLFLCCELKNKQKVVLSYQKIIIEHKAFFAKKLLAKMSPNYSTT